MTPLLLFYLSTKHLLRLHLPNRWVRYSVILLVLVLVIGSFTLGIVFGLNPPPGWANNARSPEAALNLSAMFFAANLTILATPTLITTRGALHLLNNPESVSLVLLSPVSSISKFWSSIGPLIFFSSITYFIIICPFIIMFLFIDPIVSLVTILYFVLVSGWSVVLSFLTLMLLVNYTGREKGLRIAYSLPFLLILLPVLFFKLVEDFREMAPVIGYWQLVFFGISIVVLPPIFISTSKSFYKLLTVSEESGNEYAEPTWGTYNPWVYLERRAMSWGIIYTLFSTAFLVLLEDKLKLGVLMQGIIALSVLSLVAGPLNAIMQDERNNPDRWTLAPYASMIQKAIWLKLNLPLFILGALIICYVGSEHPLWIGSVLLILLLGMVTLTSRVLTKLPALQSVIYFLLVIGCFATLAIW